MDCLEYAVLLLYLVAVRAEYAYHRAHYGAGRLWCEVVECGQGEEAESCSRGVPESTRCVPCDPGTFMSRSTRSTEGQRCSNKRVCSPNKGLILWKETDATKNRQCVCDVTLGYYSVDYDPTDPDYSAENCVFCPCNDSYIDPDRGCVPCPGLIYLDSGGYKRCKQNTSAASAETTTATAQATRTVDALVEGLDGKAAVVNESLVNSTDSLPIWQIVVAVCSATGVIIFVVVGLVLIIRKLPKRQKRHRNSQTGAETAPLHVAPPPRDGTPESRPVLANAAPSTLRPNESVRPLHQAASSRSSTTSGSYDLVSEGPSAKETDGTTTKDAGVKPAENGGPNVHCVNYIVNGRDFKFEGNYKGILSNGKMENSVIDQRLATDRKADVPVGDPTAVNINIQPAMAGTADPHENLTETPENLHSGAPETMYSVAERTAHPVQEVGDSRPPPIKLMSGTGCNTIPKRP